MSKLIFKGNYFLYAGMAGLAVTYGLNLNARLSRWILSFCKLENKIISIERIYQYSQIPGEAPPVIEDSRPPSSWPENGTIELIDLKVLSSALTVHLVQSFGSKIKTFGIGTLFTSGLLNDIFSHEF